MKKFATIFLLIALLTASFAGCGGQNPSGGDTSATGDTTAPSGDTSVEYSLGDYLEAKDLGGQEYRILSFYQQSNDAIYAETENGNIVNDAVYAKVLAVEEFLNCDIMMSELSNGENITGDAEIRASILSQEYEFDLVQAHDITLANQSLEGMYVNLTDFDIFDFSRPWWPKNTVDSLTVNGKMFLMSNHVSYFGTAETRAMFFNKKLAADYQLGNLYDVVRSGNWTYDAMGEMIKDTYKDVNNNSKKDAEDFYGFTNKYYYAWLEAFGMEFFVEDKDGLLSYDFQLDKTTKIVEAVYDLCYLTNGALPYIDGNSDDESQMFADGHSIFHYAEFRDAVSIFSFADMTYGILPMPKLDENQEDYVGGMTNRPCAIPVTVPVEKLDNVALITEALNIEGYHTVFPAYFETALKVRYADAGDDADMIDLIHENAFFSFSYLYGGGGPYQRVFFEVLSKETPSLDVASYEASTREAMKQQAEKLNDFFADDE